MLCDVMDKVYEQAEQLLYRNRAEKLFVARTFVFTLQNITTSKKLTKITTHTAFIHQTKNGSIKNKFIYKYI